VNASLAMSSNKIQIERLAPIVLTVYNRPWHTEQTLTALKANDLANQSTLYIYSDGPKQLASPEELEKINRVRELARRGTWCKDVHLVESPFNIGLLNSFIKGVTEIVNRYGKVIVLEDDQITSRGFLRFMNEALELYKDDETVMHVSGYMYPAKFVSKDTTFFLNIQSCPGWGTWKRAWDHYNNDALDHLRYFSQTKKLKRKFDIEGHAYFFDQLVRNAGSLNYSFAVRWYASCFRAGGLSLFPSRSLVKNIGLDGTGVHCGPTTMYDVQPVDYLPIEKVPIVENQVIRKSIDNFYRETLGKKSRYSLSSGAAFVMRILGARSFKKVVRIFLRKVYPELGFLEAADNNWSFVRSSLSNSTVSAKAKLFSPYHVHDSSVGDYTYMSRNSWVLQAKIGKFCSIGPNLVCGWGIHPLDCISTSPMFYSTQAQNGTTLSATDKVQERKPIIIGNDVFIGVNVTVLDGVSIGDGAVIGAGCVVSKDVPSYAIVAGNPMRVIRYRFPENIQRKLLATKWWDFSEKKLKMVETHFFDVEGFLRACEAVNPEIDL